ncbi:MAG: malto-oligosyltrehalose trehalohydrolase, partial [Knoellia sp.]
WGKPVDVDTLDGRRLVTYLQTHDQVGNRATGDRISASLTPGRTAIGAALYLLGPGTPMIFMGEEFAASSPWQFFTDFTDEGMAEVVRAGRRAEFGGHGWAAIDVPDPQSRATRDASVLRWHELSAEPHASLLGWYRELITLRRSVLGASETRFADVNCAVEDDGRLFVMTHRSIVVSADLDRDMVTVSAPGIPDLVFP